MNESNNSSRSRYDLTPAELTGVIVASVLLGASSMTIVNGTDNLPFGLLTFSGSAFYLLVMSLFLIPRKHRS